MTFQVSDYQDLIYLLRENPEWRTQLRNLLLSEDFLSLPETIRQLILVQQQTEIKMQQLIAQNIKYEERLTLIQQHIERSSDQMGDLRGKSLEQNYKENAHAYFAKILRKIKIISKQQLADLLEDILEPEQLKDALLIDLVIKGKPRISEINEIWLSIEISTVIDRHDVLRSLRRSQLIQQTGNITIPVVAGEAITGGATIEAKNLKVVVVQPGEINFWEQAIS